MRLSSVFLFAAFALLVSASPIDGYSRRSNSLSKRITDNPVGGGGGSHHTEGRSNGSTSEQRSQAGGHHQERNPSTSGVAETHPGGQPPQHTGHTPIQYRYDGTVIQDESEDESRVTFHDGRSIIFLRAAQQGGPTGQHTPYAFFEYPYPTGLKCRDFRRHGELMLSFLRRRNGQWMIFHAQEDDVEPSQHTRYTTSEEHGGDQAYGQYFYRDGQPVLSFLALINGERYIRHHGEIEWQLRP